MTTNAERAQVLESALRAGLGRNGAALAAHVTEDVRGWAPSLAVGSAAELVGALEQRDEALSQAFSGERLDVYALDVGGDLACAEWCLRMQHTGSLALSDGTTVEATDIAVTINGVTVAEFREGRICSFRHYWDELTVFEQLGLARPRHGR